MTEILDYVRRLLTDNEDLAGYQDCRNTTQKLVTELSTKFPDENVHAVVYPEAKAGVGVHYAVEAGANEEEALLINPVAAPGFPKFIGKKSQSGPLAHLFKRTDKIE